jgi:hypothetical protein
VDENPNFEDLQLFMFPSPIAVILMIWDPVAGKVSPRDIDRMEGNERLKII